MGLSGDESVGVGDGRGHEHVGFIHGIAEHETLVARALVMVVRLVHAHGDFRRLHSQDVEDLAGLRVETAGEIVVADLGDHVAHQALDVHGGACADLPGEHHDFRLDQRLAGHAGIDVLFDHGVDDRIRDLVRHLVRMTLGHGLGSEYVELRHAGSEGQAP